MEPIRTPVIIEDSLKLARGEFDWHQKYNTLIDIIDMLERRLTAKEIGRMIIDLLSKDKPFSDEFVNQLKIKGFRRILVQEMEPVDLTAMWVQVPSELWYDERGGNV